MLTLFFAMWVKWKLLDDAFPILEKTLFSLTQYLLSLNKYI